MAVEKRPPVDAVTYEVLRHRLMAINDEAAATVRRVSGSTVATEANDMNTALMTAQGEVVAIGLLSLAKASTLEAVVRDTLGHYADNPGIGPGDGFVCNDPYIGVQHQNDVALVMPVHAHGELIAWVGAEIHQVDVGGPVSGQVQVGAHDIFGEQPLMPTMRIIEAGVLRRDLERVYLRRSRLPELLGLDLRAKIAACNVARDRLQAMARREGVATVLAVMQRMLDDAEARLRMRLGSLPDATVRTRTYLDYDGAIYPVCVALRKRGDAVHFDFAGTASQAPAVINCTRNALEAVVKGYTAATLSWDFPWSPSGAGRVLSIHTEPSTLVDCTYPAGVSKSTTSILWTVGKSVGLLVGRLLSLSPATQSHAMAAWQGAKTIEELFGTTDRGRRFGGTLLDAMAGGGGAGPDADGIDTGGYLGSMGVSIANVESYELDFPILYLARSERPDSGGAGRHRGGNGIRMLYVAHGAQAIEEKVMHAVGAEMPLSGGLWGGLPSGTNRFRMKRDTDVKARLAGGEIPQELDDVSGTVEEFTAIARTSQQAGDVHLSEAMGGGGWGDPLEREPEAVAQDVWEGRVSVDHARQSYGVVVGAGGRVDGPATERERAALRQRRCEASDPPRARLDAGAVAWQQTLGPVLRLGVMAGGRVIGCRCGAVLAPVDRNYKTYLRRQCTAVQAQGVAADPAPLSPGRFQLRYFYCPACLLLIETEVAEAVSDDLWDLEPAGAGA